MQQVINLKNIKKIEAEENWKKIDKKSKKLEDIIARLEAIEMVLKLR